MPNSHRLPTALWPVLRGPAAPRSIDRPRVPAYRVGEPLRPGRDRWPEGSWYGFGPEGHELTLFTSRVTPELVDNIRRGEAEFGVSVDGPILHFAHRFGVGGSWEDVPFVWHLQDPDHRAVPAKAKPGGRALLWVSLVGANDGLIHAQRGVTLSPEFTRALHDAIRDQAQAPFDPLECVLAFSEVLGERPDASRRLRRAVARASANS